jgi:hypothetical protein
MLDVGGLKDPRPAFWPTCVPEPAIIFDMCTAIGVPPTVGRPRELGPAAREVDLTAVPSADKLFSMFTFPGPTGRMAWFTVLGAGLRSCMGSVLLMVLLLFIIVLLLLFIVGISC